MQKRYLWLGRRSGFEEKKDDGDNDQADKHMSP
jgi:hypothetical protein